MLTEGVPFIVSLSMTTITQEALIHRASCDSCHAQTLDKTKTVVPTTENYTCSRGTCLWETKCEGDRL